MMMVGLVGMFMMVIIAMMAAMAATAVSVLLTAILMTAWRVKMPSTSLNPFGV